MTIAQIEGGLGSQMFAYAAARRLALAHGATVYIDTRNFRTYTKFQPELHHFDIDAVLLSDDEADEICGPDNSKIPVVRPAHLHFDRAIIDLPTPYVLMMGNYVCQDYFFDVRDTIRKDFTRVTQPDDYGRRAREAIQAVIDDGYAPVSVHIRRGDYVTEAHTNQVHGTCSFEYYARAFSTIERMVERPWYVFFSNDPAWVAEHFGGPNRTITEPPNATAPIEDLMLMATCHHHVIANSGYSWWGAWLSDAPGQVVIAPRPFIADRSINSEDIPLRDWISLGISPDPSFT